MRKLIPYLITVLMILLLTAVYVFGADRSFEKNRAFLKAYGWEIEENTYETEEVTLPTVFDSVYSDYNKLQEEVGLDLTPYRGKTCIRYTYRVLNYPCSISDEVYANVICCRGVPIAGDIMTVRLDGFMHSLHFPAPE